jgi:hypothetical protein
MTFWFICQVCQWYFVATGICVKMNAEIDNMSNSIRIRVCLAAVQDDKLLLAPHYDTDAGPVQWTVPGGRVSYRLFQHDEN